MNKREEAIEHTKRSLEAFEEKKNALNKRTLSGIEEEKIDKLKEVLKFFES